MRFESLNSQLPLLLLANALNLLEFHQTHVSFVIIFFCHVYQSHSHFLFFFSTKPRCNIDAIFAYLGEGDFFCFFKLFSYEVFNTKALTDFAGRPYVPYRTHQIHIAIDLALFHWLQMLKHPTPNGLPLVGHKRTKFFCCFFGGSTISS